MLLAAPVSVELMFRVRLTSAADACMVSAQRACWWHAEQHARSTATLKCKEHSNVRLSQSRRPYSLLHHAEIMALQAAPGRQENVHAPCEVSS